jgi:hypothetical protein
MSTTSMVAATRFNSSYFGSEATSRISIPKTIPLVSAALSSVCIVLMSFVDYPWFGATGFVGVYTLFWISLSAIRSAEAP